MRSHNYCLGDNQDCPEMWALDSIANTQHKPKDWRGVTILHGRLPRFLHVLSWANTPTWQNMSMTRQRPIDFDIIPHLLFTDSTKSLINYKQIWYMFCRSLIAQPLWPSELKTKSTDYSMTVKIPSWRPFNQAVLRSNHQLGPGQLENAQSLVYGAPTSLGGTTTPSPGPVEGQGPEERTG